MYIVSFLRTGADEVASDETRSPVFVVCFRLNILNSFVYTVINLSNMSGTSSTEMKEYYTKKKIASIFNRLKFLTECLFEQVLPKSAPSHLRSKSHPFSASARCYLEEACADLKDHIHVLRDDLNGVTFSSTLRTKLNDFNERHRARLNVKLKTICEKSPWREAGGVI